MDIRELEYTLAEVEALRRRTMATIAQSVAAGFSSGDGLRKFINSLELDRSRQDIINADRAAILGMPELDHSTDGR